MSDDKSTVENVVDAAKAKVNEAADRARAAGHEVASKLSNNSLDAAAEKVKAVADRAKAEVHNAEAHANLDEAKREAKDGDGH